MGQVVASQSTMVQLALILVLCCYVGIAGATSADASLRLTHVTPLQVVGPIETQFNIVFVSSGFLAAETLKFAQAMRKVHAVLVNSPGGLRRTNPVLRFAHHHNVFGVFVPSLDRGATILGNPERRDTALHCTYVSQADEFDGRLDCDMDVAAQYAQTSPAGSRAVQNTLVVALVETNLIGASASAQYRGIALSTAYLTQRDDNATAGVLAHLIAHAVFGLHDEYSYGKLAGSAVPIQEGMPNCYDTRSGPIPWAQTIFEQRQWPLLAALGRDGDDAVLALDGTPNTPCEYSNFLRPSGGCLMRKRATSPTADPADATNAVDAAGVVIPSNVPGDNVLIGSERVHFCFVCMQHMTKSFLDVLERSRRLFNPSSYAGRVLLTQWSRCPLPREIVLVQPNEIVNLHTNRFATLENGFSTRWSSGDFVFAENVTTLSIQAARILEVGKQSSVTITLRTVDLMTHDRMMVPSVAEAFTSLRVAETTYEVQVVDNPRAFVGWSTRTCNNNAFQTVSDTVYRSFCPNIEQCTYNYSTSAVADATAGVRVLPLQTTAIVAAVVIIVAPWGVLAKEYQTAKAHYRDPRLLYLRLLPSKSFVITRWLVIFANILTTFLGLGLWITALKHYVVTRTISTAALLTTLLIAVVVNASGLIPLRGAVMRSYLNFIASAVVSCLSGIAVVVVLVVVSDIGAKVANAGGGGSSLKNLWVNFALASPRGACSVQEQLTCSGWEENCVRTDSDVACPRDCATNHDFRTPCSVVVANIIASRIVAVGIILKIMAGASFAFAIMSSVCARQAFLIRRKAQDIIEGAQRSEREEFLASDALSSEANVALLVTPPAHDDAPNISQADTDAGRWRSSVLKESDRVAPPFSPNELQHSAIDRTPRRRRPIFVL